MKVRGEFVDAALTALAEHGPDVSMADIARTAGAAKPKLYRHFEDKGDLYSAVLNRIQDMLWERIRSQIDLSSDPAVRILKCIVGEYVNLVQDHPNVFRFLIYSHFAQQGERTGPALAAAQQATRRNARQLGELLTAADSDVAEIDTTTLELSLYMAFASIGSATDWWFGMNRADAIAAGPDRFRTHLEHIAIAMAESTAELIGLTLHLEAPLASALRRR